MKIPKSRGQYAKEAKKPYFSAPDDIPAVFFDKQRAEKQTDVR